MYSIQSEFDSNEVILNTRYQEVSPCLGPLTQVDYTLIDETFEKASQKVVYAMLFATFNSLLWFSLLSCNK
jgi:hypothetical protein